MSACEGIREHDAKGSIMLVGAEHELPYHRPQLFPQILGKGKVNHDKLHVHDTDWFKRKHIDLRLGTIVTQFNLERKIAVLANGQAVEFKKACLATGGRARRPQVAGATLGNVFYLRSLKDVLGVITFYTVGETEARAWTLQHGQTALDAAESVHSDIARGFIRAEVIRWDDLLEAGSHAEAARRGLQRLEGKAYVVEDGDVVNVRFNV